VILIAIILLRTTSFRWLVPYALIIGNVIGFGYARERQDGEADLRQERRRDLCLRGGVLAGRILVAMSAVA